MRPGKAIFIFGLLIVASFFGFIPIPVFAVSGPFLDNANQTVGVPPSNGLALTTSHTGDEWIAIVTTATFPQFGSCPTAPVPTVTGISGAPTGWVQRQSVSICDIAAGQFKTMEEWEFAAYCAGSCSGGTIHLTESPSLALNSLIALAAFYNVDPTNPFDPSVTLPNAPCTATAAPTSASVFCTVSTSNSNDALLGFSIGINASGLSQWSPGFIRLYESAPGSPPSYQGGLGEYQTVTTAGSYSISVLFPGGSSFSDMIIGDVLTANPLVSTLVIPCNFFQVQCWMYPLLMMSLVGGLMFAAVEPSRPSKEAITYILLASFTFTSAVEVLMGLLPITMPLLLTVIMVVYAWRFR